jgi:hypothetical protein
MALEHMVTETVIPETKEMVLNAINDFVERRLYGQSRRYRRGPMVNRTNYSGMYQGGPQSPVQRQIPQTMSRPNRMRHSFDDILIGTRIEAEEVLDRMYDILADFEEVTVADLYELTGIEAQHTDRKWGWEDLRGARVGRVRGGGGYLLELPEPISL